MSYGQAPHAGGKFLIQALFKKIYVSISDLGAILPSRQQLRLMKYDDILSVVRALIEPRFMCQVGAKRYMGANSWNSCSDTEGPMAPLNMLWLGVVLEPREAMPPLCWVGGTGGEGKAQGFCIFYRVYSGEPVLPALYHSNWTAKEKEGRGEMGATAQCEAS